MEFNRIKHTFSNEILNQLKSYRKLDNWHGLMAVLYDYVVIFFAMLLLHYSVWFIPVSLILIGSRQRALATVLHESVHCALAKSRGLNYFLGTYMSGYLIFQEFYTYRDSHVKRHHAFLGDPERDPDYAYHRSEQIYQYNGCLSFFNQYIFKPLTFQKTGSYFWYLINHRMKPSKQYFKEFASMFAYWAGIIAACLYFEWGQYLLLWFVSLLTSASIIGWFNELAEHYPLVAKHSKDIEMTRNRFSHWLEHFIFNTHAENYHLVHHLQPSIPFWNLKRANEILCSDSEYQKLNQEMGGIFCSSNGKPSLISKLLTVPAVNQLGNIQYE